MRRFRLAAIVLAGLFLHACATAPAPGPAATPGAPAAKSGPSSAAIAEPKPSIFTAEEARAMLAPPPPAAPALTGDLRPADLPGWAREDHVAALIAYQASCSLSRQPASQATCNAARILDQPSEETARRFLETAFRAEPLDGAGLLTAYFSPQYEARDKPGGDFVAAVRPAPADLRPGEVYADRKTIEARPPNGALAWMRPEDLFFLQIQGSGTLVYPDGRRMKAIFAAHNSRPFVGIAGPMRDRGLLSASDTSGEAIRHWLADNRGPKAATIMRLDPRYVFFRLEPDDGAEPVGSAGIALPPGHAIAVDPAFHDPGEVIWIDAAAPTLTGAFPTYQRLVVALDAGGAIKGDIRADLYLGKGDDAGREAGRVRHDLRMYRLVPLEQ